MAVSLLFATVTLPSAREADVFESQVRGARLEISPHGTYGRKVEVYVRSTEGIEAVRDSLNNYYNSLQFPDQHSVLFHVVD
jgi:hypothetical protein